ncbi:MAG: DNA polymerase Y family protein [Burkholderiales bacterium]|nr:DNA polymerase Y family protein [Burkholderiales bacterium]
MVWIALFFERLSLQAIERGWVDASADTAADSPCGAAAGGPALAIADPLRVLAANDPARAAGITPGLKRAAALALAPQLLLRERDAALETGALAALAGWAQQFTPAVSLQSAPLFGIDDDVVAPAGLLLDVGASLRYFGGLARLLARLQRQLPGLGFSARLAVAPNADAAWLLARHRDGLRVDEAGLARAIGALPATLLATERAQKQMLAAIGLPRVHDLQQLPRAGLVRRFGRTLLDELDFALGHRVRPRRWFEAPAQFEQRIELMASVEHAPALLFGARRLLQLLAGWLMARQQAAREVELAIEHDGCADTVLPVRLAEPSHDAARLELLLREQLGRLRLPAAAQALRLCCRQPVTQALPSGELFPGAARAQEQLGRVIERLQARLGSEHVQRLQLAADHRPEAAYRIEAIDTLPGRPSETPAHQPGPGLPRPLWLLDEPIALAERNQRPYWQSPLTLLAGPERIEGGWWDEALVQRDYFVAENREHALLWIYRERFARPDGERGWFLHGCFG